MENESTVKLISLDTIPVQEVEWLVYPFIPSGKITIIQGDPGEGKTTFILQLIARLTTGRPAWEMHKVGVLAEKHHCAIVLIGHMNKNSGEKSSYRGLGSIDFQATARSVLVVGRIKDDPTLRVVCPTKSSLAPEGKAIAFRLDPEQGFQWVGVYDISAEDLLSGNSRGHKLREAQKFLREVLAEGALPQTEIEAAAERKGIKPKTLRNARYELGITSRKVGKQWLWELPQE